jgi:hypothetical protein
MVGRLKMAASYHQTPSALLNGHIHELNLAIGRRHRAVTDYLGSGIKYAVVNVARIDRQRLSDS